ncbi:SMEK domain-containing protein [Pseudomonas kribbensis]|uniref:SMEK domain-containing protein n=1 Tax=Pseudomonas kribbensis TaxID=1628086 RepID=UPI003BF7B0CF
MITRGHFLGEIIDEFATISEKVKMRTGLGLTDLPVYAENFVRDIFNIVMGAKFENLNKDRSNEPGLDLGDPSINIGIQVTATATSEKIKKTLEKITNDQLKTYKKIIVLIISKKQNSYTIPDSTTKTTLNFSEDDIWDLGDLIRKAFDLDLPQLQRLHKLVRSEVARLKVELEIPDEDGKYPTSGYDMWEASPQKKIGDGVQFSTFLTDERLVPTEELKQTVYAIEELILALSRLPRITREFLVMLHNRRGTGSRRFKRDGWEAALYSTIQRLYQGNDLNGELEILEDAGFVEVNGEDPDEYGPVEIGIRINGKVEKLNWVLNLFAESKEIDLRKVIGEVDFSAF